MRGCGCFTLPDVTAGVCPSVNEILVMLLIHWSSKDRNRGVLNIKHSESSLLYDAILSILYPTLRVYVTIWG